MANGAHGQEPSTLKEDQGGSWDGGMAVTLTSPALPHSLWEVLWFLTDEEVLVFAVRIPLSPSSLPVSWPVILQ